MNRLAQETSPYLRQHKDNPVDWYPWGRDALARAKAENKPILLSIGYSACHWCHVMEHESFENDAIARLMNQRFVCIKVDREERPDLDHIYQGVAQAITRGGGWPLTVFLTPELKPYFGGTYFPPEDRYGRPGFPRVLEALSDAFAQDPAGVAENAEKLTAFIRGMDRVPAPGEGGEPLSQEQLERAAESAAGAFDPELGGLRGAPKFPNAMLLSFLGRASRDGSPERAVFHVTLDRMAAGGIFDQLGGGFHRYSVDETWSVPHFEKMLYDNGLLLRAYSEAWLAGGLEPGRSELYLRVLRMTVDYLLREMLGPEGAFFAAQDADSEGEEGKFFVWTPREIDALVGRGVITREGAQAFVDRFGVSMQGNFEHGATVLFLDHPGPDSPELAQACRALFEERSKRVAPATDCKCLASWNGSAISGLAWASQALRVAGDSERAGRALASAREAFDCVVSRFKGPDGRLSATLQEGQPKHAAYLDDYAFMAQAALDLSRFAQDDAQVAPLVAQARQWIDIVLESFAAGPGEPGYYFTADDHEALIHRPKTVYDQAIPSGTAVTCSVLAALGALLDDGSERYSDEARRQLSLLSDLASKAPLGVGELLCASWLAALGPVTVQGAQAQDLCRHPHVFRKPGPASKGWLVCHQGTCLPPLSSQEETLEALRVSSRI